MIAKVLSRIGIEVWKDIPEYVGLYQVSNLGNVRSLNYLKQGFVKELKKYINSGSGRKSVSLCKNGKVSTNQNVYVLVAKAFLNHKSCGHKLVVDHIDNNALNDNLYNLQVITQRKNISKLIKNSTSKYTGVSKKTKEKKWTAQIQVNGKVKHLGYFTDEKKASEAYQNELKKINESKPTTL